ncbi:hypothetical protein ACTMTI_46055 [Nonomuraea sp. H19]|uniref:hypothetical protein n=1 Tax=Nonomuraea sp. H19 TaxID=3452206 RepID=UPI003F8A8385
MNPFPSTAERTAAAARAGMGAATATLGWFAMLASFMPTNYNWDPGMPDYSDPDSVRLAMVASGFATFLTAAATALLWRSRVAVLVLCLLLAVDIYRFVTLLPHYEG